MLNCMNKLKLVGVFNPEWQLVTVVAYESGSLVITDILPHNYSQIIAHVLERLKTENPKLNLPVKDEAGCVIDMVRVEPGDERYLDGVANELKQTGLQAYSLDAVLCEILKKVNGKPVSLRTQVLPEVVTLETDHALVVLEAIL